MSGFKKFLLRGNVVELAVAVVIGTAFTAIVNSFVKDVLTPLIAAVGGQPDFSDLKLTLGRADFTYGNFLNALIGFLMIATVIYFLVVNPYERLQNRFFPKETPDERECPECLSMIPKPARRCAHCTAEVTPVTDQATSAP
ncbi:large conductance mechanosensitive channel protein MscL [Bailinhaonella thermotolerans]|uniref:Large-conductance mechanosensitive channel n=1 Tax=Bailinhaonella thermotolerans TaxID=1070861 RepID=A0A3A4AWH0_9ACTN|nr:large conductance mechanosensitive channel protein MscL [Bailinhaonella thermotolerans]RJL33223.1 large conductance mechanosensitive channel protein MscL [Bailinhaonella thermotolerans]